jgi:hypothetical protein
MSVPKLFFLDTSILAGQGYNFSSAAFASFVNTAKERGLTLLLPDPTQREIKRQIRERSIEALKALETARRKAPFLAKWKHYPRNPEGRIAEWEVERIAFGEWDAFLKQFQVARLGYEGIAIASIMDWYEKPRAPFAEGKKSREFPDAFAIAILGVHASATHDTIAVVSSDGDFKRACTYYPSLLYFPSLPSLTEALLEDVSRVETIKELLGSSNAMLEEAVVEAASELPVYHVDERFGDVEEIYDTEFTIEDVSVVALGVDECTVSFGGGLSYGARLRFRWEEHDERYEPYALRVRDSAVLTGTAKLQLTPDLSSIDSVTFLELDEREIQVTENPW